MLIVQFTPVTDLTKFAFDNDLMMVLPHSLNTVKASP